MATHNGRLITCPQECGHSPRNHNRHGCRRTRQHRCTCLWVPGGDQHLMRDMANPPDLIRRSRLVRKFRNMVTYWPHRNRPKEAPLAPGDSRTGTV